MDHIKCQKRVIFLKDILLLKVLADEIDALPNSSKIIKCVLTARKGNEDFEDSVLSSLCDVVIPACKNTILKVKYEEILNDFLQSSNGISTKACDFIK